MDKADAKSSTIALQSQWKSWTEFCSSTNAESLAPSPDQVLQYYHHYFQSHTVASFWPTDSNFRKNLFRRGYISEPVWPPRTKDSVKRLEKGLRKERPFTVDKKRPITTALLRDLHAEVTWDRWDQVRVYTMIALATVCMFRVSEVASLTWSQLKHDTQKRSWWIRLTQSKTVARTSCGYQDVHIFNVKQVPELECVKLLSTYQSLSQAQFGALTKSQPMFPTEAGCTPSAQSITADIRKAISATSRQASQYSVHSCRAGGYSILLAAGYPPAAVQAQGRWASAKAAQEYFRSAIPEAVAEIWSPIKTRR